MEPVKIIEELEALNTYEEIDIGDLDNLIDSISYNEIKHYLRTFKIGTKPEHATQELLKRLVDDVLLREGFAEVKIKGGFVDFAIQENVVNPILIELKPGFEKITNDSGDVIKIKAKTLDYINHKDQIQKYLLGNDFVILTNLKNAYLFNREAIIDYEPFYEIKFPELLRQFLSCENLWDTVHRLEDQSIKPELENEFFNDLKKWFDELSTMHYIEKNGFRKNEIIVLFINKMIFVKTLEDYGLIPFHYLIEEYQRLKYMWEVKSMAKCFEHFFRQTEEFFEYFYDTELFSTNIWEYLPEDEDEWRKFGRVFERVLGFGEWELSFGKGLVHYDYRKIDEDVFGKAYETFIASQRKDSGIFYTHRHITTYMSNRLVSELFEPAVSKVLQALDNLDFSSAQTAIDKMYNISIADTSSGSGSFLIKVLRDIYSYYNKIFQKLDWAREIHSIWEVPKKVTQAQEFLDRALYNNKRKLMASIILRHIHAIDIDERAIETAKTNLWKEAVKIEPKLFSFRKIGKETNHILPNLQLNFICADTLFDLPISDQLNIISSKYKPDIIKLFQIRDAYINNPYRPDILHEAKQIKQKLREGLTPNLKPLTRPTLICLEFFYLYFDYEGNPLPTEKQGFSGIISNPPWEEIYPVAKEFADIGKYEMDRADFEKEFEKKLKKDKAFAKEWEKYCQFYKDYTEFVSENYTYHNLKPETSVAMRSHLNYFKLLFERDLQIIQPGGFLNILIPSSFQTDEGCFGLRNLSLIDNTLHELFSFENRGFKENPEDKTNTKIFPDVDNRFKFSIVLVQKVKPKDDNAFNTHFYLHDPKDLYIKNPLKYSLNLARKFSPHNLSIMEFASQTDYNLCEKMLNNHDLLGQLGYNFRREFHVTDDANILIKEKGKKDVFPVYEGKSIHQFTSAYADINNYIEKAIVNKELINKETKRIKADLNLDIKTNEVSSYFVKNNFKLDFQTYRLAYRAIGSSTNERTLICTVLYPNSVSVHSLNYLINFTYQKAGKYFKQIQQDYWKTIYLMSLLNSLTLNYYIRNKISANLTMNFIYELPIPAATEELKNKIVKLGFSLLYHKSNSKEYEDLKKELGITIPAKINDIKTRAELEIIIARDLFSLNKTDWQYLTSTFVYGEDSATKLELDEIISASKEYFN